MNKGEALNILDRIVSERERELKSEQEKFWIEWKATHSRKVLEIGQQILDVEPELKYIRENL